VTEVRARSIIERDRVVDELEERRYQATRQKTRRMQKVKEERLSNQLRIDRDKGFGRSFLALSRQLNHVREIAQAKKREAYQQLAVRESATVSRQRMIETQNLAKGHQAEIDQQKKKLAELDRIITEGRLNAEKSIRNDRLRQICEKKRKITQKTGEKILTDLPKPPLPVRRDDLKAAAAEIGEFLGANLGGLEAKRLVDLIEHILDYRH
jgi:hypothetical protein